MINDNYGPQRRDGTKKHKVVFCQEGTKFSSSSSSFFVPFAPLCLSGYPFTTTCFFI